MTAGQQQQDSNSNSNDSNSNSNDSNRKSLKNPRCSNKNQPPHQKKKSVSILVGQACDGVEPPNSKHLIKKCIFGK